MAGLATYIALRRTQRTHLQDPVCSGFDIQFGLLTFLAGIATLLPVLTRRSAGFCRW